VGFLLEGHGVRGRPVDVAVRLESLPLALAGGPVEHARARHRVAVGGPDRDLSGRVVQRPPVPVRVHEVLRRLVEQFERVEDVVDAVRAPDLVDRLDGPRRGQPRPLHADATGGPGQRLAVAPAGEHGTVNALGHLDLDVVGVGDGDGLRARLELADLVAVPVRRTVVPGLVRVEVDDVVPGVRESPRASVVPPDDDEGHARERDAADVALTVDGDVLLVPDRRDAQVQVRVVRHHGVPRRGVFAADDPRVRPDALGRLERLQPRHQLGVDDVARARGLGADGSTGVAAGRVRFAVARSQDGRVVVARVRERVESLGGLAVERVRDRRPAERRETPRESPRDLFLCEDGVHGRPRVRVVVQQFELHGSRGRFAVRVHARRERLARGPGRAVARRLPRHLGGAREVHLAVEPVGVDRHVPDDGRQFAAHHAPQEVHLEQPVGGLHVPDRVVRRAFVGGGDVGNALVVVADRRLAVRRRHHVRNRPTVGVPRRPGERREVREELACVRQCHPADAGAEDRREECSTRRIGDHAVDVNSPRTNSFTPTIFFPLGHHSRQKHG